MNKRIYLILSFFFLCARLSAMELTATVTAYNAAKATPILTEQQWVAFTNTNHSKGNIGVGDTATLQIGGLPSGSVSQLTAYISSNKSSGSADVTCCIAHNEQTIASGPFNKWKPSRCWSTDALPFSVKGTWSISPEDTITLTIIGTANSVHLEKMVVTYTPAAPQAHCINLTWQTPDGTWHNQTLQETSPEAGLRLPDISPADTSERWFFEGWTPESFLTSSVPPVIYEPGKIIYPTEDMSLYGLYYGCDETIDIVQDTSYSSGEYALLAQYGDTWYMLSGLSQNGSMTAQQTTVQFRNGRYQLNEQYVDSNHRYIIAFMEDSLSIVHIPSHGRVGYSNKKLATHSSLWAWEPKSQHSLCIYTPDTTKTGANYMLWLDEKDDNIAACLLPFLRNTMNIGWIMMNLTNVPEHEPDKQYTTQPFDITNLLLHELKKRYPSTEKYLHKGRVYIQSHTHYFYTNGQLLL